MQRTASYSSENVGVGSLITCNNTTTASSLEMQENELHPDVTQNN